MLIRCVVTLYPNLYSPIGSTGVYIIFLIFALNIDEAVLRGTYNLYIVHNNVTFRLEIAEFKFVDATS